ncbi:MAG: hypothetical protein AB1782_08880 [Cyanobacteriota bacterium]
MSPNFFPVGHEHGPHRRGGHHGHNVTVYSGSSHAGQWNNHNAGWYDNQYESHEYETYRGKMDDATRNWLVGGAAGQVLANLIAPNDPDAAYTIGTFANLATTIGLIRDSGREQYHHERHEYGRDQGAWNQSSHGWYSGSSNTIIDQLGLGNCPWICY